jgi:hypothetical protein
MIKISRFVKKKGSERYRLFSSQSYDSMTHDEAIANSMRWARSGERSGMMKTIKHDYSNLGRDFTIVQESGKTGNRTMTRIQDKPWATAKKGGK